MVTSLSIEQKKMYWWDFIVYNFCIFGTEKIIIKATPIMRERQKIMIYEVYEKMRPLTPHTLYAFGVKVKLPFFNLISDFINSCVIFKRVSGIIDASCLHSLFSKTSLYGSVQILLTCSLHLSVLISRWWRWRWR